MEFTEFTRDTLPFILTFVLGWVFVNLSPSGDPADISNRAKINASYLIGILLGVALMFYESKATLIETARDYKLWIKYVLIGLLVGASAIGLNQAQKAYQKQKEEPKQ